MGVAGFRVDIVFSEAEVVTAGFFVPTVTTCVTASLSTVEETISELTSTPFTSFVTLTFSFTPS